MNCHPPIILWFFFPKITCTNLFCSGTSNRVYHSYTCMLNLHLLWIERDKNRWHKMFLAWIQIDEREKTAYNTHTHAMSWWQLIQFPINWKMSTARWTKRNYEANERAHNKINFESIFSDWFSARFYTKMNNCWKYLNRVRASNGKRDL